MKIEDLDKKLENYRHSREKKLLWLRVKHYIWKFISFCTFGINIKELILQVLKVTKNNEVKLNEKTKDLELKEINVCSAPKTFSVIQIVLRLIIWCVLFTYAVYIQFGAVFIILTGFYVIYTNTRTEPRQQNEISAYSVFNPNCEPIDGTLNAEQFENEIRHGLIF